MRRSPNYKLLEVALLVTRFAALAVATRYRRSSTYEAQLADIESALCRMPEPLYAALRLRGLERRRNVEAAVELQVHANTASRRYMQGLRWLHQYLNAPSHIPELRVIAWREWAWASEDSVVHVFEDSRQGGPGRYPVIPLDIDTRVLELHCAGSTEREIADLLNAEFERRDGSWTRSSVRSVLRRYQAPKRPTGKRPHQLGSYRVTRPDYREVAFGEPLCDPSVLLERHPRREKN